MAFAGKVVPIRDMKGTVGPLPYRTPTTGGAENDAALPMHPLEGLDDFYPKNEEEHAELVTWCQQAFQAADNHRQQYETRWKRYYRLYRSYVKRQTGDWHSKVFYPIVFWVVEAITPRLVADLPKFVAHAVGPEDVAGAKLMEQLLEWAKNQSGLYVELVKSTKSALKYGTGILKTYEKQVTAKARRMVPQTKDITVPQTNPVLDEMGQPMYDADGTAVVETKEVVVAQVPDGFTLQPYTYSIYEGPAAEAIDIENFWPAPEAEDIQSARFVIHRAFREMSEIQRRVRDGIYRFPDNMGPSDITNISDPIQDRLASIDLVPSSSNTNDPTRKPVELLEFWTDDGRVITLANRKAILRCHENPFDHGEKPFVRIVDYLAEHEFWGIGEIEPLEGMQDLINALANQRIDNVRLVLNSMFAVNTKHIEDLRDLTPRPGGIVRTKGDLPAREVIERINLGDVTPSAFQEVQMAEQTVEKVSAVTAYQLGTETEHMNATATGVSLVQEAGATRFTLKSRLAELMGLRDLARQFGGLLIQFTTEQKVVRLLGPQGDVIFQQFDPEAIAGSYDYDIDSESEVQTESQKRADAMSLLQTLAPLNPMAIPKLIQDLVEAYGKHDVQSYLPPGMTPDGQPMPMGPGAATAPGTAGIPMLPPGIQPPQPILPQERLGIAAPVGG
jgi:hypothetical protein